MERIRRNHDDTLVYDPSSSKQNCFLVSSSVVTINTHSCIKRGRVLVSLQLQTVLFRLRCARFPCNQLEAICCGQQPKRNRTRKQQATLNTVISNCHVACIVSLIDESHTISPTVPFLGARTTRTTTTTTTQKHIHTVAPSELDGDGNYFLMATATTLMKSMATVNRWGR